MKQNKPEKKATKQIPILRYTVSRLRKYFVTTITHKIFETHYSFHVNQRTTGKV